MRLHEKTVWIFPYGYIRINSVTRAVHLYRGGMPLALLSEFLGHVSVETTRIYAYADTEIKRNAIKKATPKTVEVEETPIWDTSDDEVLRRLAGLR